MALKRILLVDDDEAFNFLNRMIFTENGVACHIDDVIDGKAALEYLQNSGDCPDVILLDLNMPVMDGFEFLEHFKDYNKCRDISKVYILTSSNREEDKQKSLANKHVMGYFDKPLNSVHVKQIIEQTLSHKHKPDSQ